MELAPTRNRRPTGCPRPPGPAGGRRQGGARELQPGFFERLFGGAKKRVAALQQAVQVARAADDQVHADAMRSYQEEFASWNTMRGLAGRMIQRDASAYSDALAAAGAFDELSDFQTRVAVSDAQPDAVVFTCTMTDDEIVPREEVKLTATKKLTTKAMAASRFWTLYQDHVCSAALRVASEAFAVLPVSRAVVNIGPVAVNTQTGHREPSTYLAVHVQRDSLQRLNLIQIDPSDSMKNFPHRMKFKKSSGFEPVEPMTLDEHWVTT